MTDTVWTFKTANFTVELRITPDHGYQYDGEDPDGEVQARLDSGEYEAFDSDVVVLLDGREIGCSSLGGAVYDAREIDTFWTAHRGLAPMGRNCSIMRAQHPAGPNVVICHYFPAMVREAISAARQHLAFVPHLRNVA